jgi:outer membrane protein
MTTQQNKTLIPHLFKHMNIKLKHIIIPFLIAGFLFSAAANAQDRTITLNEAIKLGLQNSKPLKLAQARIDEAVSQYNQAKDQVKPTASASFGYDRAEIPANVINFGSEKIGLPQNDNAYLGILSVNEVIFNGNKFRFAQQSTELLTQVSRLDADLNRDEITYDIINAYYNLYKVLQSKKVVAQNIATIDQQIKQSQRFFDQGLVTKNDVLRFQLQRANVELNGIDLETNRKIVNYNLNILLGLPESTQLKVDTIVLANTQIAPVSNYLDTALASRKEIKQYDLRGQVAEVNIKTINANKSVNLSASGSAYYVGISGNPLPENGNYLFPVVIGVNLSWNFATLWTNKNKEAQGKIQREEVDINKNITIDNIKRDVNQSYQNYAMAVNKITLLQTSIAQAGENNNILESKYKSNIASATDRADAETLLYQAQINLELAKADAGLAYYTLLKSTGKLNK